ncbi:hypothetical protein [Streptomyces sp. NP-1717]|uniref:hypothetical protein n=1 Tax=unclassified Streptomyces TaxID=2593676 RepID=UPI001F5DDB02|nr:hypothetical protein [Streptomyces sp. NP-1717]MCI3221537.1 hypothetical protein [Streptomyces sp. NP-1717]WTA77156.1 hypothetical protein OG705_31935 [Streptomyces sp. NBC_00838]
MAENEKRGKDRADELRALIDELETGTDRPDAPAPKGPRGESLREAVHRRMRELRARGHDSKEEPPPDGDEST